MFSIRPIVKPQPAAPSYPVTELFLFNRHTRATFKAVTGEEAPVYDPHRPIKRWADTTALMAPTGMPYADPENELIQYSVWDENAKQIMQKVMTRAQAASINLPGKVVYPKWEPSATTTAVVVSLYDGSTQPINGKALLDQATANFLADELHEQLGLSSSNVIDVSDRTNGAYQIVYGAETRRKFEIEMQRLGGESISADASALAQERFRAGYKVPGKWAVSDTGYPKFVPDVQPDSDMDVRPEISFPVRALLPNEKLVVTPFGASVYRLDLQPGNQPDVSNNGAGLTRDQEAVLNSIKADTAAIRSVLQS